MEHRSMFVGLDVHKETIDVSIAEGHREGEVRHYGVIAGDLLRQPARMVQYARDVRHRGFATGPQPKLGVFLQRSPSRLDRQTTIRLPPYSVSS